MEEVCVVQLVLDYPAHDHPIEVTRGLADLVEQGTPFDHHGSDLDADLAQLRLHDFCDILPHIIPVVVLDGDGKSNPCGVFTHAVSVPIHPTRCGEQSPGGILIVRHGIPAYRRVIRPVERRHTPVCYGPVAL